MKQIKVYCDRYGKVRVDNPNILLDGEHNSIQVVVSMAGLGLTNHFKRLDILVGKDKTVGMLPSPYDYPIGDVLTVTLTSAHLKSGYLRLQPVAFIDGDGGITEQVKWEVIELKTKYSVNANVATTSIQVFITDYIGDLLNVKSITTNTLGAGEQATVSITTASDGLTFIFGIPQGIQGEQGIQGLKGNQWRGAYSGSNAYVVDDVVSYLGSSYICILASTDNLPTNTTYWDIFAQADNFSIVSDTANATPIIVSDYAYGIAQVEIQWGTSHFEGSSDGATYVILSAINTETSTPFSRIDMRGSYYLDLRGITHLKYIVDYTAGGLTNSPNAVIEMSTFFSAPPTPKITKSSKRYAPSKLITTEPAPLPSNRILCDVDLSTGTLYANSGPFISKSTNYGVSFTNIFTTSPWGISVTLNNGLVRKLHNGKILAIIVNNSGNTDIWLSDVNEQNFTLVKTFPQQGIISLGFGVSIYHDTVLIAFYKMPRVSTDPLDVWCSQDGGLTWKSIYSVPAVTGLHTHDVAYDPYTNRIWLSVGDNYSLAQILYTDNFGTTWSKLWEDGEAKTQITSISIAPNFIVFGTDQVGYQGAWIYYKNNLTGNVFEPSFARGEIGRSGDASYRGRQYWDSGNAIYYTSVNPYVIIGTKDGVNYYELYTNITKSVIYVHGVDVNNKIIGFGNNGMLIDDAPLWEEI